MCSIGLILHGAWPRDVAIQVNPMCVGGWTMNAQHQVQFFHPSPEMPTQTWMSPVSSVSLPIPEPVRKLDMAAGLGELAGSALDDCAILFETFAMFRRVYKENPVGGQQEIVRALAGDNPRKVAFVSPEQISDDWTIADRWGTAYFFHQVSGDLTEVISAGPDKQFGTADDVQYPDPPPSPW